MDGGENLSLNFWSGRKGTGDFQKQLWRVNAEGLPPAALVDAVAAAAAADATAAAFTSTAATTRSAAFASASASASASTAPASALAASDDALLASSESLAELCLLASRHVEGSSAALLGEARSGAFLNALASGQDGQAFGEAAARHGARMRAELIALLGASAANDEQALGAGSAELRLGARRCNALLRAMTRHGRLHPGLAPPVSGAVVNSERGELTSLATYEALVYGACGVEQPPPLATELIHIDT